MGTLAFYAGRAAAAEARLPAAWQANDPAREASVGAEAAFQLELLCLIAGRIPEAIEWGERAAAGGTAPSAIRHRALGLLALALFGNGRGPEGLAQMAFLPAAPADVSREDADTLVTLPQPSTAVPLRPAAGPDGERAVPPEAGRREGGKAGTPCPSREQAAGKAFKRVALNRYSTTSSRKAPDPAGRSRTGTRSAPGQVNAGQGLF